MSFFDQEKAIELIPEYMHAGFRRYLDDGIEPGGFLMAVLCNDLRAAVGQADETNLNALYEYIIFLRNYVPSAAWGSHEKVYAWLEARAND